MAIPGEMSKHLNEWIGTYPSPWWIYLRLRLRGYLSPCASGAAVRRIIRESIREWEGPRRKAPATPRAGGATEQLAGFIDLPRPGASWNAAVPPRLSFFGNSRSTEELMMQDV